MKSIWMTALIAALCSNGFAATKTSTGSSSDSATSTASTATFADTTTSHWSLSLNGTGFGMGLSSPSKGTSSFTVTTGPAIEYFVMDNLAVGAATMFTTSFRTGSTVLSAGPSATYHFWNDGKFSAYGRGAYIFNNLTSKAGGSGSFDMAVGMNYNFAPWFGVGPRMSASFSSASTTLSAEAINLFFYL